jgi:plastocyanin
MRPIVRGSAVLAASLLLAACSGGGSATTAPTSAGPTTAPPASQPGTASACAPVEGDPATTVTASIEGSTFVPATINAKVGDVITWTNADSVPHGIELDDGPACTKTIGGGTSGSGSFSQAGTFPFHCSVHASMKGSFTIAAA